MPICGCSIANAEAIELARQAIEMGTDDPRAITSVIQAWNTLGSARILTGDLGGIADLETSLALALEHGIDRQAASAYGVCASALGEVYQFGEAERWFEDGLRYTRIGLDSTASTSGVVGLSTCTARWGAR